MSNETITREEWLLKGIEVLRARLFEPMGTLLPVVKVSVGFPAGSRPTGTNLVRGQIWAASSTADGIAQIFISPQIDNAVDALGVLAHELVHACTPGSGHGGAFKALAHAIGLAGPMRSTVPGPGLLDKLTKLAGFLGPYPHAAINLADRKPQITRLLKRVCSKGSGYSVRLTQKWLHAHGAPICPCHVVAMVEES